MAQNIFKLKCSIARLYHPINTVFIVVVFNQEVTFSFNELY